MQPGAGRRSAFARAFSSLLLPVLACTTRSDAHTPERSTVPEPAAAAVAQASDATQGAGTASQFVVPDTEAGKVLGAAMARARATDRLLFVHSGADW